MISFVQFADFSAAIRYQLAKERIQVLLDATANISKNGNNN